MRRKINFKGRVQGVGFRWHTKEALHAFTVTGYVKNLSNGTVEILLEGRREEVVASMNAVEERMRGYWTSRDWEDFEGEESQWAEFSIQY
tara:strand:+ start:103 stop:372 length:270 start_codon:yes stop_codon:yes gene_type:complete